MINAVWTMSNGKAKFKGLSPCHTPLDEVFTAVMLKGILGISMPRFCFFCFFFSRSKGYLFGTCDGSSYNKKFCEEIYRQKL